VPERSSTALAADVVLTRTFHAPRALVWQVWTDPDHLAKWWGPHTFSNPLVEIDLRPGGALRVDMQGPDGVNAMTGQVREVVAPERFVFTSMLESDGHTYVEVLNTVTLTEQHGVTTVTLVAHVLQAAPEAFEDLAGMHEGWRQSFERLESQVATSASEYEMVVSRLLNAPRELVFDVWTDPRHLGEWWGPVGFTTSTQHMDLRPGGEWIHVMHGPDGIDYPNHTVFIEVNRPSRLVYTNRGGDAVTDPASFEATVTFDEQDGRTRVTMRARFASAAEKARIMREYGAYEGAHQMFDRLAQHLAGRTDNPLNVE
jgi:uncharacterized protein YndB with AHSA1/START domain